MNISMEGVFQDVKTWLAKKPFHQMEIGRQFVRLNAILNAADTPEIWRPAIEVMGEFLQVLNDELKRDLSEKNWKKSDSARFFSILLTVMAEAGQYRFETFMPSSEKDQIYRKEIDKDLLPLMGKLRRQAVAIAKGYFSRPVFAPLKLDLEQEMFPLLDTMILELNPDRFMPFRVIQVGNVHEKIRSLMLRTIDEALVGDGIEIGLLQEIYNRKYLRFGTSGVRGVWGVDFTEQRAKQVVQAICDVLNGEGIPAYAGAEKLSGKRIVIGYDSRWFADVAASWAAEVCLANGFSVDLANRDTPTPALVYYLTDHLHPDEVAGLINCTASHNPPEWQGIKFNPRLGYPAATNLTDYIAVRINELQLLEIPIATSDLMEARRQGKMRGFDTITHYTRWIFDSGNGNQRVRLDWERMRKFCDGRLVVVDEMHGAARGYLSKALGEIGIRHTVIHAECDPDIPGLDYANPEEPFINELKAKVRETGAVLGMGTDTDADRFGVVDAGGEYFRPNQILPMLVRYLRKERNMTGKVIATQTGSPIIETLAGMGVDNTAYEPEGDVIPAYVAHPFYKLLIGEANTRVYHHTFFVPVGIKYIEEQRRTDRKYRALKPLPSNWRDILLIGGEESSGLTTRGHVTDKDGVWAGLLILDMLAYFATRTGGKPLTSLRAIWEDTCTLPGCWTPYGGSEDMGSNTGRTDVDAVLEAKEELINYYLDTLASNPKTKVAGMEVIYAGGVRYDLVELQLRDSDGDDRHFLRIRASGTEPINRIYAESSKVETAKRMMQEVLEHLETLTIRQVEEAYSLWRLVDILIVSRFTLKTVEAVHFQLKDKGWSEQELINLLNTTYPCVERRSKHLIHQWAEGLA
jgi:phosphoglucomutase